MIIQEGRPDHRPGQPLNVPVILASNFRAGPPSIEGSGREYSRDDGTPAWEALEDIVGRLEDGSAVLFSSGMAAIAAVLDLLPLGATVVTPVDCYSGVRALLSDGDAIGRWKLRTVDMTRPDTVKDMLSEADLLWLETPSNPLLDLVDIRDLATAARGLGVAVAVDNTFATPLLQNPLALGADFVVHSATKFIGGHSDLLLGIAVCKEPAQRELLIRRREVAGATPGALECFLALRGIRTMSVRLVQSQDNAAELARRLSEHPAVARVRYPGLPTHPGHDIAAAQMNGFGGVLSFELAEAATADAVCAAVRIIHSATSLGGVESTIERRAKLPGQEHVPPGLLRLSVGCEHIEDLWRDLLEALPAANIATAGEHNIALRA
ncbi:PLP-dependent transferase [Micromonospora yasonensis]|uniref:trans-sulfuration enzyme family protein n=1 Tax=Micromonospora yasonensis TaxID=1128667 RepID=UPI00223013D7|nr:PLP-dependent transferase [Micromonospora yasonensis]MCW3840634.1 PLP-dependent transferase [Micromonospora yasonensis]